MAEDKLIVGLSADIGDLQKNLNTAQSELKSFASGAAASAQPAVNSLRGLSNSVNQISRELPAFGVSANVGFLAVSNNIPILIDEINRLKDANIRLAASGQPTQSIFKSLTSAIFSFQTGLSLGVTLLTLYGGKLLEMAQEAFANGRSFDSLEQRMKSYNEALESKATINAVKNITLLKGELEQAKKGIIDKNQVIAKYNESVGLLTGKVTTLGEVEQGLINNTTAYVKAVIAREAATLQAAKAAETYIKLNEAKSKSDKDYMSASVMMSGSITKDFKDNAATLQQVREQEKINREKLAKEAHAKDVAELQKTYDDQLKIIVGFQNEAGGLLNDGTGGTAKNLGVNSVAQLEAALSKLEAKRITLNVDSAEFRQATIDAELLRLKIEELNDTSYLSTAITTPLKEIKVKTNEANLALNGLKGSFRDVTSEGSATMIPLLDELSESGLEFVNVFGQGITGAFESALNGTQSFGDAFGKMLKQLLARILAAVAAAAALSAILNIASGGAGFAINGVKFGFKEILGRLSGGLLGAGGSSNRVVSPVGVGAMGQGSVEFNIMGDKLYGVLKNYTSRLDRLQ
jgi:hypothetical protein